MSRALQKTIHVACRALGLNAEQRRELQLVVTGKASMRDMDEGDLQRVLDRLKVDGFKIKGSGKRKAAPRADLRLVHVLWRKLGEAGALKRPDRDGLNAFVRTRFGDVWGAVPADIDMLQDAEKIDAVVQALKVWGKREKINFDWGRMGR